MFQVFQFAPGVLAIALDDVKNAQGIPFEESPEGTSRKARPHMSGQSRAAHVRFNAPGDAFLNREVAAKVAVICRPFPGCRDARHEAYDGTGSTAVIPATRSSNAISVPTATHLSGERTPRAMCSGFDLSHQLSRSDNCVQTTSAVARIETVSVNSNKTASRQQ